MRRLIEQRIALQSQLAEQSTTLLSQHPRIKELNAQIAETDRQIKAEGERLARQLDNDAKVAGDRIKTLTASLDQVKKMASQSNEQDVKLRALEREAKTERELLEVLFAEISRGQRPRQHQRGAAGSAHHLARLARAQSGLSEEAADRADRRLRRLRAVDRLHGDRRAAGAAAVALSLSIRRGRLRPGGYAPQPAHGRADRAAHGFAALGAGAIARLCAATAWLWRAAARLRHAAEP